VNREQVKNRNRSFLQKSVEFYGAGTNWFRNIQLNRNWTRARLRYKRIAIGASRSSGICFAAGSLISGGLFSGIKVNLNERILLTVARHPDLNSTAGRVIREPGKNFPGFRLTEM
tara:strand:- start:11469 stop:11813 length:345 start_codon:yes stop_codon:yes gene_type:complete